MLVAPRTKSELEAPDITPVFVAVPLLFKVSRLLVDRSSAPETVRLAPEATVHAVADQVAAEWAMIAGSLAVHVDYHGFYDAALEATVEQVLNDMLTEVAPRHFTAEEIGAPVAAAILVQNATGVTISNLILDGLNNGFGDCNGNPIGIYYQNASGTAGFNAIRNFKLGAGLEGCQSGLGIFVEAGAGGIAKVQNVFMWQRSADGARNRQATEAAIEDEDGRSGGQSVGRRNWSGGEMTNDE